MFVIHRRQNLQIQFRRALLLEDYRNANLEVDRSLKLAHTIVQWGLAIYGVFLGIGLAVANLALHVYSHETVRIGALLLFSVVIPGIAASTAITWLGELFRLERAAAYARSLETRLNAIATIDDELETAAIHWHSEVKRWRATRSGNFGVFAFLGTAGLFFVAVATACIISVLLNLEFSTIWGGPIWSILAVAVFVVFLAIAIPTGRATIRTGKLDRLPTDTHDVVTGA